MREQSKSAKYLAMRFTGIAQGEIVYAEVMPLVAQTETMLDKELAMFGPGISWDRTYVELITLTEAGNESN